MVLLKRITEGKDAKQLIGLVVGLLIMGVSYFLPASPDLSHEATMSLGVLLGTVVMWLCGTMATGAAGMLGVLALVVLGVMPSLPEAMSGFIAPTTWFVLGVFCMTALMQKSTLGIRLTKRFIMWAGADSRKLVLAIMGVTTLCSAIMTDTGAVALSMSFALPLLGLIGAKAGSSNLGRCLMIGISFGACFGGFTTPIGHSLNVLALGLMEQQAGITVGFLEWMTYGVPIALIILPLAWLFITKAFPPEAISEDDIKTLMDNQFNVGKMTAHDVKSLVLLIAIPVLWILGNWIPFLNATTVALFGMLMLFVPGMNILTWKEFESMTSWNLILFFGTVLSLGGAVTATGAADWIAALFLNSGILDLPLFVSLLMIGIILYLVNSVVPIALTWTTIFTLPLVYFAQAVGIAPVAPVFLMVCLTAGSFIIPLCPSMNMTLDTGYYTFGEALKSGWETSIAIVLVAAIWVFFIAGVLGL